jgi:hypothetical protein
VSRVAVFSCVGVLLFCVCFTGKPISIWKIATGISTRENCIFLALYGQLKQAVELNDLG